MKTIDYINMFGTPEGKSLIRKALTTATPGGGPLIKEQMETVITNELVRLVPELAVPEYIWDPQDVHRFNKVISLPGAGSAMGEASITPTKNSQIQKTFIPLKIFKRKGAVTGFLQAAASATYSARDVETEQHLSAFANDLACNFLYGNAAADPYSFSGLDHYIASNRVNETWGGVVPTTLKFLDDLIDASNEKKGHTHRRVFEMSPFMLSKVGSFYTNVRDNRDVMQGTKAIQINGGWRLETYRYIPIVESSQTRPKGQMGAVISAHAGSGGAIPDDTRYFQVAPITWDGEQIASPEVADTSVSSDTITLTWTAYENALFYRIYAGDTSGQAKLVKIVSAFTYDANGTVTGDNTGVTFTSEPLTADGTSVPSFMADDIPYNYTGGIPPETVFLWDLHPHQGLGKVAYTNQNGQMLNGIATIEDLSKTDDTDDFLIKSYLALVPSFEKTSGMHRGLRVA